MLLLHVQRIRQLCKVGRHAGNGFVYVLHGLHIVHVEVGVAKGILCVVVDRRTCFINNTAGTILNVVQHSTSLVFNLGNPAPNFFFGVSK